MGRVLLGWLLGLGGNAIGLIVASLLLGNDFNIGIWDGLWDGFIVSLVVFAVLSAIFTWLVFRTIVRHAGSLLPLTGLVSTFLALLLTDLLTEGLSVAGWGWLWGTLIVWVLGMFIWVIPGPWRKYKKDSVGPRK
jgi:hypothetical protein